MAPPYMVSAPLREIRLLRNQCNIDVDLSRSLKVKYNGFIRLSIYAFLLMLNSNIWPN